MRKKTRIKLLVGLLGLILFVGTSAGVYLFQDQKLSQQKNDYENYIQQLEERKVKGYILTNDVQAGQELKEADIKEALIDRLLAPEDLIVTKVDIIGRTSKICLSAKQLLTAGCLYDAATLTADLREFELSSAVLPSYLKVLDYVDVRINYPTGLDYVVLSKKKVTDILNTEDAQSRQFLKFVINADEILRLSSAIVDAFYKKGTYLYAIKYVEPDAQAEALVNYPVNPDVRQLILTDPNIVSRAQLSLEKTSRDALMASFAGYTMLEVREKPQGVILQAEDEENKVSKTGLEAVEATETGALQDHLE
jgi:hypothetical protein